MKKFSLIVTILVSMVVGTRVQAQCTVSNLTIQPISFNAATCVAEFNISFDQEVNSGNKFAYIHLWKASDYHTPAPNWVGMYDGPSDYPVAADLVNAVATIAIEFNGTANPTIGLVYYPDNTVTPLSAGLTITKTLLPDGITERETISGIEVTLPSCAGVVSVMGDIWASQGQNGKNVHCAVEGLTFNINNPLITSAFKVCNPRSLTFGIKNNGTTDIAGFFYRIYKDDGDGIFEPGVGVGLDGSAIITSAAGNLAAGVTLSEFQLAFPGNNTPGENSSFWLEAVDPSAAFTTVAYMANNAVGCAPLPVKFKSFTATRNGGSVLLKWETSTEQNSAGFYIERNEGAEWKNVGYVPTQANAGNSTEALSYAHVDANTVKGVTQYRIRQVDMDAKSKFSEVRSVRGEGQTLSTIVYPNPSVDGKINIVFNEGVAQRTITVADLNGRVIKQMNSVSNNNITIENLQPGVYTVRVMIPATGEVSVTKVIVSQR